MTTKTIHTAPQQHVTWRAWWQDEQGRKVSEAIEAKTEKEAKEKLRGESFTDSLERPLLSGVGPLRGGLGDKP